MAKLFVTLIISLLVFGSKAKAQSYNENDKAGLRALLRQKSSDKSTLNLERLGLSITDTATWKTSEDWITKLHDSFSPSYIDWEWTSSVPSRLITLKIKNIEDESPSGAVLSGTFDCFYFSELQELDCSFQQFVGLNISSNSKLQILNCTGNKLSALNVSQNKRLRALNCSKNEIIDLNVKQNEELIYIDCSDNQLTTLSLLYNPKLESVSCANNKIATFGVSMNESLTYLDCSNNNLSKLALNKNAALENVYVSNNAISNLDLASNGDLYAIFATHNSSMTNLNLANSKKAKVLNVSNSKLSKLNLKQNVDLEYLSCENNNLAQLDISNNSFLQSLNLANNKVEELNTGTNQFLQYLNCENNLLTILDLANSNDLGYLNCANNALTTVSVANVISHVICNDNNLIFSELPILSNKLSEYVTLTYTPQGKINGGDIDVEDALDLGAEYSFNGKNTSYNWINAASEGISVIPETDGVFQFNNETGLDKILLCEMTNATFPGLTISYEVTVLKDKASGIEDVDNDDTLIYFDPSGSLNIESEDVIKSLALFDMLGRLVKQENVMGRTSKLDTQSLPQGVYVIKMTMESNKITVKKLRKSF